MPEAGTAPTHSVLIERRVLGAALRDFGCLQKVRGTLREHDFATSDHKRVFVALLDEDAYPREIEPTLFAVDLVQQGHLPEDRALVVISDLLSEAVPPSALDQYIKRLIDLSDGRVLAQIGSDMQAAGIASGGDHAALAKSIEDSEGRLRKLTERVITAPWSTMHELADKMRTEDPLKPLFRTGFHDLDRMLGGGFKPGQLVVIAGRPAQGKSTLALDVARSASIDQGVPGLYISLEMSGSEIAARFISAQTGVALSAIQSNEIEEEDLDVVEGEIERIIDSPLHVIDNIDATQPSIMTAIRNAHTRLGIKYCVVDYAQLISGDNTLSREQVVSSFSRALKNESRMLSDLCIILVAQLNRGPEQRTDHTPRASDLRESGQLEQDADVIIMINRPETRQEGERPGEADLILNKQRNGPTGTVVCAFQGGYARFVSIAREAEPPSEYESPASPTMTSSWADPSPRQ